MRILIAPLVALLSWPALAQQLPQPQVITQPTNDNSSRAASTAYVDRSALAEQLRAKTAEAGLLPIAGGALAGNIACQAGKACDISGLSVSASASAQAGTLARWLAAPNFAGAAGVPALTLSPLSGQNLAIFAGATLSGYVPYWNGGGTTLNRVDADGTGAIGQGRIFAPEVHIWTDRLDNGTSNGTSADPYGQPSNGINTVSLQLLEHYVGGGTGVRETQRINTIFDAPSKAWNVNRNYVASRRRVSVTVSDSGSSNRPAGDAGFTGGSGAFFADNPEAFAGPNAKNLLEVALSEGNVGIRSGGSARILYGHSVVKVSDVQGDVIDAAFSTGTFPGSTPFKDQILFSDAHGGTPLDPNGTVMRVGQYNGTTQSVGTIFDFSKLSAANRILVAPLVDWRPSVFALTSNSLTMIIPGLPTSDPHVAGQWWRDGSNGNVIKMSGG